MEKDALLKEDGIENLARHGHQILNDFKGFKAEEAPQLSNLETKLVEMVWQDDSSGLESLLKHTSEHELESPHSKDEDLDPNFAARLLQLTCKLDSVRCAQVLIEGKTAMSVNINEMDCFGRSPLHTAAEMLSAKCVGLLLQKHARADLRSNDGDALLALEISLASQRMHISWSPEESVEELLVSLKGMDLTVIRLLAEATNNLTDLFYMMVVDGRVVELASLLLVAAEKLKVAASIHGKNNSLSAEKHKTMYELVLEESLILLEMVKGGQCRNSLHWIHEKRQALLCQIKLLHLFGFASTINWGNNKDFAPPLRAFQAGDELLAEVLIRKSLDANEINEDGNSSLHLYLKGDTSSQDPRILRSLLKCGARLYQHNKLGLTPIHLASLKGNYESLQILLLHAPDCVDILSVTNETPLFFAVKGNYANCAKLLLQFGANRDALNLRKQRPIDLAPSEEMRVILRTVYPKTLGRNNPSQEDDATYIFDEELCEGMLQGFLELKADNAKLYNKSNCKEMDTKIGICRYFHSPNGCGRGSKCYYSHGEEAPRLEKSRLLEVKANLLRYNKDPANFNDDLQLKIFVGGLPPSVDSDDLKKFFEEEFGPVDDALVVGTRVGNRVISKGFGFLTFKQEDTTKMAVKAHFVTLYGKTIEIKSALPRCHVENSTSLSDRELFKEDEPDEANNRMPCCGVGEHPPWLIRFKKWFPAYLKKTCRRLGEGEWYPLSSLKGDFRATCGMELDHEAIGYLKLSDFLRSLPGICKLQVISTGNGSPTHMVLRPSCTLPCNEPQQPKLSSCAALPPSSSQFTSPENSSSISEISDGTYLSEENVCVESFGSMQRSVNFGKWEHNPGRLDDGFREFEMWTSPGLFDQPSLLEKIAPRDGTQQPFSYFARQWDSDQVARDYCIVCKAGFCKASPGNCIVSPNLHKLCHSCKKDLSSSSISCSYYSCIQPQKPAGFYDAFPSLLEAAYSATDIQHLPSSAQPNQNLRIQNCGQW